MRSIGFIGWKRCVSFLGVAVLLWQAAPARCLGETPASGTGKQSEIDPGTRISWDIGHLRTVLARTLPTANITPIRLTDNVVLLTGTVARDEDVDVAVRAAQSIDCLQVVNGLRIAGVPQMKLDIVLVQVQRGVTKKELLPFLESAGKVVMDKHRLEQPFSALLNSNKEAEELLKRIVTLREAGHAKILAQPSLTTLSGTPGSFLCGYEQAVPVSAGLGSVGVQFEELGTRLNYLPTVRSGGKIVLEVEPEVSYLSAANGRKVGEETVPGRVNNCSHVTAELATGQTMVLGGLVSHSIQETARKTPLLSDLPLIGECFTSKKSVETEEEILILVTPTIVESAHTTAPNASDEVRERLERRLQRLEQEMADLRRELRSLPTRR